MYRVKWSIWNNIDGRMASFERYVKTMDDAGDHLANTMHDSFKVFDADDQVVASGRSDSNTERYA